MRTIRDLRDFINVSRLNYNYDDEDDESSPVGAIASAATVTTKTTSIGNSKQILKPISSNKTPQVKNERVGGESSSKVNLLLNRNSVPRLSVNNTTKSIIVDDNKTRKSLVLSKSIVVSNLNDIIDFSSNSNNGDEIDNGGGYDILAVEGNFDQMLTYIDTFIVSEWLNRSNKNLNEMFSWLEENKCSSFIHFADFWLTKINDKQRRDLINMEYSIIVEEISQAFLIGMESDKLSHRDVTNLLKAVFKEYPLALLSFRGLYLLLDYVDILCSDRKDDYKKLLSDVKCKTLNKQYAQWLLSIRSFALVNLCSSVVKFYQNATSEPSVLDLLRAKSAPSTAAGSKKSEDKKQKYPISMEMSFISTSIDVKLKSYKECVFKNDYAEVLHYLIVTKKLDPLEKDEHNRTLIFLAVMNDQPKILNYLIKRCPKIDINEPCDTGNTPLHAAVNNGKIKIVEILLKSTNLNVNLVNDSCMSATALHLAVWHSYDEIAINLVRNKGDPYLKMGTDGLNAFELAKENDNQVLAELLLEFYNEEKNVRESISSSTSNNVFVKASVDLNNNKIVDKK